MVETACGACPGRITITLTGRGERTRASGPVQRVVRMEHGVDGNLCRLDFEDNAVRKPPKQRPTHHGIDELIGFWMAPDGRHRRADRREELAGAAGTLRVIPRVCGIKIKLRLRSETKSPYFRRSSLARTSPQGFAADGLRACARRRLASSLRCASLTGMASGVAARPGRITSRSAAEASIASRGPLKRRVRRLIDRTPTQSSPPHSIT